MERLKIYFENDKLWVLRKISLDLFQNKGMQILRLFVLICLAFLQLIQSYLFLQKFDSSYFIKFLPLYAAFFFVLTALYAIPHLAETVSRLLDEHTQWPERDASSQTRKKIRNEAIYFNTFAIINLFIALYSGVTHILPLEDDENIYYPLAIFDEFGVWKNGLSWIFRLFFIPIAIFTTSAFIVAIYGIGLLRFQMYLYIDFMANFSRRTPRNVFHGQQFQTEVRQGMKICIHRYADIYNTVSKVSKNLSRINLYFSITGAFIAISVMVFVFSFQGSYEGRYVRIITLVVSGGLTFVHVIISGQSIEDVCFQAYQIAKQFSWYDWNQENKRSYFMLLFILDQPLRFQCTETTSVNYELGVSIAKSTYSVVSVMSQLI